MAEIEFLYIGWCNTGKSDKVWTAFRADSNFYAGWGARGKTINFKKHPFRKDLDKLIRTKERKYNEVDSFQLFTIFPHFTEEVESRLTFCLMTNKIK